MSTTNEPGCEGDLACDGRRLAVTTAARPAAACRGEIMCIERLLQVPAATSPALTDSRVAASFSGDLLACGE